MTPQATTSTPDASPAAASTAAPVTPSDSVAARGAGSFWRPLDAALALLCMLVAVAVFWPSVNAYFVSDAFGYIAEVLAPGWSPWPYLAPFPLSGRHGINPSTSYYQPVQIATVWLAVKLGGLDPRPYHLLQIALHAGATAGVFMATRRLVAGAGPTPAWGVASLAVSRVAGVAASLFFAVHFGAVEATVWFGALNNVLTGFWVSVTLALALEWLLGGRAWAGWLAVGAAAAAVGSHTVGLPILFVLVWLVWLFRGAWRDAPARSQVMMAFLAVAAVSLALELPALRFGAIGEARGMPGYSLRPGAGTLLNALYYPASILAPLQEGTFVGLRNAFEALLSGQGGEPIQVALSDQHAATFGLAALATLASLAAALLSGNRAARFAAGSFALTMLPFISLRGQGYRYLYVLVIFVAYLVALTVGNLWARYGERSRNPWRRSLLIGVLLGTLLVIGAETQRQIYWWREGGLVVQSTLIQLRDQLPTPPPGARIVVGGLPNSFFDQGVFIWRAGFSEAVQLVYQRSDLDIQGYSRPEVERLWAQELRSRPNTYAFIWEDRRLVRLV